jgi:hypothetical protein
MDFNRLGTSPNFCELQLVKARLQLCNFSMVVDKFMTLARPPPFQVSRTTSAHSASRFQQASNLKEDLLLPAPAEVGAHRLAILGLPPQGTSYTIQDWQVPCPIFPLQRPRTLFVTPSEFSAFKTQVP